MAGWAFVTLTPNTSAFASGDAGHLYFELTAPHQGNQTEGGFEVYSDTSIAPYARSTAPEYANNNGYVDIHGGSERYFAGQRMAIFHGLTDSGLFVYTNSGLVPSNIDPETSWINSQKIALERPGWIFFDSPNDMRNTSGGSDPLGHYTPCSGCSVSKVTSIAQNNTNSYSQDGSYFGLTSAYENAIIWEQVAFGNWAQNCEPGTSLCTFNTSNNPYSYYGGPQYYPNDLWSYSNEAPSRYGPYETYDGIDATAYTGGMSRVRYPKGVFAEPLPPAPTPPCTVDSYGACGVYLEESMSTCDPGDGNLISYAAEWYYQGYSDGQTYDFYGNQSPMGAQCYQFTAAWTESPQTHYNDPNLPGSNSSPP